jgi:hypothetical protein
VSASSTLWRAGHVAHGVTGAQVEAHGGELRARAGGLGLRGGVGVEGERPLDGGGGAEGAIDAVVPRGEVEREAARHDADENEHHEADALLAVVGAVREAHAAAGGDEQRAHARRRRRIARRRDEQRLVGRVAPREEEQRSGGEEAEEGRHHEREGNLAGLGPVDAVAENRSDEGVRARRGEALVPGGEVPPDGGHEEGEHHGEARVRAARHEELDGQQLHDAQGHRDAPNKHPREVERARERHGDPRQQRVGVDHRGHRVGRVVKPVHELEGQGHREAREQRHRGPRAEAMIEQGFHGLFVLPCGRVSRRRR